jgi:hypothetical protein
VVRPTQATTITKTKITNTLPRFTVLALFASTEHEWLRPNEAAKKLKFCPTEVRLDIPEKALELRFIGAAIGRQGNVGVPD